MKRVVTATADGSPTIYLPDIDEHYHSVKGALTESLHVFIASGLERYIEIWQPEAVTVLEVGFGTGLNAVLTAEAASAADVKVNYVTYELYPVDTETALGMYGTTSAVDPALLRALHEAPWEQPVRITPTFTIHKIKADLTAATAIAARPDVVYYDAFAPEKQPAMWSPQLFGLITDAMTPGAVLTTYCAKGVVRRMLASCGLEPERLPGPPGGKREILRATKPGSRYP